MSARDDSGQSQTVNDSIGQLSSPRISRIGHRIKVSFFNGTRPNMATSIRFVQSFKTRSTERCELVSVASVSSGRAGLATSSIESNIETVFRDFCSRKTATMFAKS